MCFFCCFLCVCVFYACFCFGFFFCFCLFDLVERRKSFLKFYFLVYIYIYFLGGAFCELHDRLTRSRHGSRNKQRTSIHHNLVAEPVEAIHAEFVRLATELEAVKGQEQTECKALRDLFARTTTAMSSSVSSARQEAEPQGSWEALTTAIRWMPSRLW